MTTPAVFDLKYLQNVPQFSQNDCSLSTMHAHFSAFTTLLQWLGPALDEGWCRPSPLPISAQQPVKRKGFVLVGAGV